MPSPALPGIEIPYWSPGRSGFQKNVRSFNMSLRPKGPRPLHSLKSLGNKNRVTNNGTPKLNRHLVGGRTHLEKYARQIGKLLRIELKIKNVWNHHLDFYSINTSLTPNRVHIRHHWAIETKCFFRFLSQKRNLKHPACFIGWLVPAVGCSRCRWCLGSPMTVWLGWGNNPNHTLKPETHSRAVHPGRLTWNIIMEVGLEDHFPF